MVKLSQKKAYIIEQELYTLRVQNFVDFTNLSSIRKIKYQWKSFQNVIGEFKYIATHEIFILNSFPNQ